MLFYFINGAYVKPKFKILINKTVTKKAALITTVFRGAFFKKEGKINEKIL